MRFVLCVHSLGLITSVDISLERDRATLQVCIHPILPSFVGKGTTRDVSAVSLILDSQHWLISRQNDRAPARNKPISPSFAGNEICPQSVDTLVVLYSLLRVQCFQFILYLCQSCIPFNCLHTWYPSENKAKNRKCSSFNTFDENTHSI